MSTVPAIGERPINILIVDDEPGNLMVLESVLDDPNYRLVRAESPDQALLALVEEEFALLILDIRLPGMSGFELAQMIKERRKTAGVPIIFLTAYYDKDQHVLEGYGSGAVDFLNKPVNPAVLRSKVAVFADLHRKNRAITLANSALMVEVMERRRAEEQLRNLNETLEQRVSERTEALRRADHKLQAMMNSITDGLLMLDRNWCFTYCNEQGARLLGKRVEQLLGACIWDLFPHARGTPIEESFRRAAHTGQAASFEAFYPQPLNRWLRCHCHPSDDGLAAYLHDITDRREVEVRREQLLAAEQAARNEGERVARAKDEFLASLSHELRTPLAAIMGWVTLLERPDTHAQTVRRGLDAIARNARAQVHLVDDLLDMSRIVSGKLLVNTEPVNLNAIAAAAADTAGPAAQSKGVRLDVRLADGPSIDIIGDTQRLQQIASNLLTNALKFTPAGGAVTISTRVNEGRAELAVTDTGEGIAAEFLPHLFDRFSQADHAAARVHGGIGLGLSIVKNLVELHAGTVTASSAGKGLGSCFKLQFPRAPNAARHQALSVPTPPAAEPAQLRAAAHRPPPDGRIDLQGVAVLLVDDNADMLEVQRRLLFDCGAAVTTAGSAEQALKALRSGRFDVLLSDLGLPAMDGYGLIDSIRSKLGLSAAQLPAAAVTAFVRPEDHERAVQAGYQACLVKPVSPTALARLVHDLVHGSGAERARLTNGMQRQLRLLLVEDNVDLREQIGWLLQEDGIAVVSCASGEEAEVDFAKGSFDVVMTDVSLPRMTGVELAHSLLAQAPELWVIFSTGYPIGDGLGKLGPRVRSLLKPFEMDDLHRVLAEVRADLRRLA